ncbi:hypothetical protein [Kitasatospora sp. NPDC005856]|uniref:hypothetical protein n=1 Tax=Kitasatospora sp. NPDC005856 TaxID=3154566 RepID=UPI0033D7054B
MTDHHGQGAAVCAGPPLRAAAARPGPHRPPGPVLRASLPPGRPTLAPPGRTGPTAELLAAAQVLIGAPASGLSKAADRQLRRHLSAHARGEDLLLPHLRAATADLAHRAHRLRLPDTPHTRRLRTALTTYLNAWNTAHTHHDDGPAAPDANRPGPAARAPSTDFRHRHLVTEAPGAACDGAAEAAFLGSTAG